MTEPAPSTSTPALPSPDPQKSRTLRRFAPRLLLAALTGLVALKLADVLVGVVANSRERHLLRLVPESSLRHRSNEFDYVFRVNRLGLRGPDVPFSKPAGTFRIVVLGDSFVAGYGVAEEHLLTGYLQEELAGRTRERPGAGESAPRAIEVVNVGRVGTSTIRELDLYEKLGRRFEPDLVVLAYYLGNDRAEIMQEQTRAQLAGWH
ncbi:MAG: SGNH/GDSL hydrolase family protein, partial [Deltaproteobacteria bacterium]